MVILKKLGEIRLRSMRVAQYFNLVTAIGTIFTVVKVYGLPIWTISFVVPILAIIYVVDGRHAVSGEIDYMNSKNKQWQEMIDTMRRIESKL